MSEELVGPYRLRELRRRGANGEVWLGWDTRLNQRVEVSRPPPLQAGDPEVFHQAFVARVRELAELRHASLITPTGFSRLDDEQEWYATEDPPGIPILQLLDGLGRLVWRQATAILHEVARALAFLHEHGVCHGHLSTRTVWVDMSGYVSLSSIDVMGCVLASTLGDGKADLASVWDDLTCIAPEILQSRAPSIRGDIFSLGVVGYELLTGQQAFTSVGALTSYAPSRRSAPDPGSVVGDVPLELRRLLQSLLAARPEARPGSIHRVRDTLRQVLRQTGVADPRRNLREHLERQHAVFRGDKETLPERRKTEPQLASRRSRVEEQGGRAGRARRPTEPSLHPRADGRRPTAPVRSTGPAVSAAGTVPTRDTEPRLVRERGADSGPRIGRRRDTEPVMGGLERRGTAPGMGGGAKRGTEPGLGQGGRRRGDLPILGRSAGASAAGTDLRHGRGSGARERRSSKRPDTARLGTGELSKGPRRRATDQLAKGSDRRGTRPRLEPRGTAELEAGGGARRRETAPRSAKERSAEARRLVAAMDRQLEDQRQRSDPQRTRRRRLAVAAGIGVPLIALGALPFLLADPDAVPTAGAGDGRWDLVARPPPSSPIGAVADPALEDRVEEPIEALTHKAELFVDQGLGPQAESMARTAVALSRGRDGEALLALGTALSAQGRVDAAVAAWLRADDVSWGVPTGALRAGALLAERGRCAEAIEHLDVADLRFRAVDGLDATRGRCLLLLERWQEAKLALQSAWAEDESDAAVTRGLATVHKALGEWAAAREMYRRTVSLAPEDEASRTALARLALETRVPQEAIAAVAGTEPDDPRAAEIRGHAAFAAGRWVDAARQLSIATALLGDDAPSVLLRNLAVALDRSGRPKAAIDAYARAARAAPEDAELPFLLGRLLRRSGHDKVAARWLTSSLHKDPEQVPAWFELGLAELGLGHPERAEGAFLAVLKRTPRDLDALQNLGKARLDAGRTEAAARAFERMAELAPSDPQPVLTLAALMQRMERPRDAAIYLAKACRRGAKEACR